MIGRESESRRLSQALRRVRRGPVACVVEGDPGIGKTTLLAQAAAIAARLGCLVLAATPEPAEAILPYTGLSDLCGPLTDAVGGLPDALRLPLLAALVGGAGPAPPGRMRSVAAATLELLRRQSAARPLALVIDDAQWLDASSAGALRYAVRRLQREQLALILSRRPGSQAEGLETALEPARRRRIELGPLPAADIDRILDGRWGAGVGRSRRAEIVRQSGGNPYLALELAAAPDARPGVPESARDWVGERLDGLPPAVAKAVLVTALARRPAAADVRRALGARGPAAVQGALDAGVLVEDGSRVALAHPLIGTVAVEDAAAAEVRRIHGRLAAITGDPVDRAWHLARSAVRPDAERAQAIARGAAAARARSAGAEAAQLYLEAVRAAPDARGRRVRGWQLDAADCFAACGEGEQATRLLRQLSEPPATGPIRARALARLGVLEYRLGGLQPAVGTLREARAEAAGDDVLQSLIEQRLAIAEVMSGQIPEGAQTALAALERARGTGDERAVADADSFLGMVEFLGGRPGALERLRARPAPHREAPTGDWGSTPSELRTETLRALAASVAGPVEEGRQELEALYRAAAEGGDDWSTPYLLSVLLDARLVCGRWDEAEALRRDADAIADAGPSMMADFVEVSLARLAACRGRLREARRRARSALRAGRQSGIVPLIYNATWVLGFCDLASGDHAATDRRLGPLVAAMVEVGLGEPAFARFVPDELEALVRLDRLDEAERALAVWEQRGGELERHFALATGARCRALLCGARGERAAALDACAEALDRHRLLGEPFEEARTRLVAGSLLRRARRRSAARGMLEAALDEFTRLGARSWRAAAEAELARLAGGSGDGALTAAEQRVAAEVARGRSNREVAAALYISESTVEGTLWRVYRKLGVRSRSELAHLLATAPPEAR